MKSLAELVLSLCELAEAEGRNLRRSALIAGQGCALTCGAVLLVLASLGLVICAGYDVLVMFVPRYVAFLLTAALAALFAVILFWSAKKCMPVQKKKKQPAPKRES